MPRSQKALTVAALVVVIGVVVAGTATAASHYIITKLSQISPHVRSELKGNRGPTGPRGPRGAVGPAGTSGAVVAVGSAKKLAANTPLVTLPLKVAPALVTGSVVLDNSDSSDHDVTCVVRLDNVTVSPPVTVDAAATNPILSANDATTTLPLSTAVNKTGVLSLQCSDADSSGAVTATGTLTAVTTSVALLVTPTPTASSASPSASASASSTSTPTSSSSASASSSSSSSSCPDPTGLLC